MRDGGRKDALGCEPIIRVTKRAGERRRVSEKSKTRGTIPERKCRILMYDAKNEWCVVRILGLLIIEFIFARQN
jgi:hypothetical protein